MKKREKDLKTLYSGIIFLILMLFCLVISCCNQEAVLIPVGDARVIQHLESGNYEVTPAFLIWAYDLKAENKLLKLEIKRYKEILEKIR